MALITHVSPTAGFRINEKRNSDIASGFYWAAKDATFDTDAKSLSLVTGRVAKIQAQNLLSVSAPDFYWRASDNTDHLFTAPEFLEFAVAMDNWVESKYIESWVAKAAL